MKNTRIFCAKSALDQPSAENNLTFNGFLKNAEYFYRNQCPEPNAAGILNFIAGKHSDIDTIHISYNYVNCSIAGQPGSTQKRFLQIAASTKGKTVTFFRMPEDIHTAETLEVIAHALSAAVIRRALQDFDWIEEYELDLSKFAFIGLFPFMDLKPRNMTYEEFVPTDSVLPILPSTPEDYLNGNHVAILRCGKKSLQITSLDKFVSLELKF